MLIAFIVIFIILILAGVIYYFLIMDRADFYEKAMMLAMKGSHTDARAMIRTKLSSDPHNGKAHFYLSRIYAMEGDTENELVHYKEIVNSSLFTPEIKQTDILKKIADIYYDREDFENSFKSYMDLLKVNPNHEEALARLAFMAIGQEEFQTAESYFKDLVKVNPSSSDYHLARGVGLSMLGKQEALGEFEEALRLKSDETTTLFLTTFQAFKQNRMDRALELVDKIQNQPVGNNVIMTLIYRLAAAIYYSTGNYLKALTTTEKALEISSNEGWRKEEYDARLTIAYMAMLLDNLEKANDHLLELEIQNHTDELVMRVSDYRMDLEEGIATLNDTSPRGFNFQNHMKDWLRDRFPGNAIYRLSGLQMDEKIDVSVLSSREKGTGPVSSRKSPSNSYVDMDAILEKFNSLGESQFNQTCEKIINSQGYKMIKNIPRGDKDGADFITQNTADKKIKALFSIRQWSNQPISDIFLRNMQNQMNELKASYGFVIAGARLTPGAKSALENLKKITVINEVDLANLLTDVMS